MTVTLNEVKGLAVRFFAALRMTGLGGCVGKCTNVMCFALASNLFFELAGEPLRVLPGLVGHTDLHGIAPPPQLLSRERRLDVSTLGTGSVRGVKLVHSVGVEDKRVKLRVVRTLRTILDVLVALVEQLVAPLTPDEE